jgi:hypothetical protein
MNNGLVYYWIVCAVISGYILHKQSMKISIDGVIGNSPFFNTLLAVLGGGLFAPIYFIIKIIRKISNPNGSRQEA